MSIQKSREPNQRCTSTYLPEESKTCGIANINASKTHYKLFCICLHWIEWHTQCAVGAGALHTNNVQSILCILWLCALLWCGTKQWNNITTTPPTILYLAMRNNTGYVYSIIAHKCRRKHFRDNQHINWSIISQSFESLS